MASKTESTKAAAAKDKPDDAEPKTTSDGADETPATEAATEAPADEVVSDCVVNGGKGMHVGRAVNGKVCSYHAMHYDPNGNPR